MELLVSLVFEGLLRYAVVKMKNAARIIFFLFVRLNSRKQNPDSSTGKGETIQ